MGRGNCCVSGKYEGLYYIDNEDLYLYTPRGETAWEEPELKLLRDIPFEDLNDWEYSRVDTQQWEEDVIAQFQTDLTDRFPSLTPCSKWVSRDQKAILENNLFYIALQDNEWSIAVELLQKEVLYCNLAPLQKRHYEAYLNGIRDALFNQFDTIYIRTGPWTCGQLNREEAV